MVTYEKTYAKVIRPAASVALAAALALTSPAALAADDDDDSCGASAVSELFHAPVSAAVAHEGLSLNVEIIHPQQIKRTLLLYRSGKDKPYREVAFRRKKDGPYQAAIPEEDVLPPGLAYAIEVERPNGTRSAIFSSRAEPHPVQVPEDGMDQIERVLDQRVDHRRVVFAGGGEYVDFGHSTAQVQNANGELDERTVNDRYYRVEGSFTYRPLRTIAEFGIRLGVVRGSAPVPVRPPLPGQEEDERFEVGLNYGAPWVRFRMGEHWHLDASSLVSVTEVGFSAGGGGTLHIGDPYGSKLSVGFEGIHQFGARFFSQVDIQAHRNLRISPIIEVTNMPSADEFGVRLLAEAAIDIGWGFGLLGRAGYQARDATSGGPTAGGALSYAF
ncbi:MAG: hypothetical protein DRI90_18695 [Deltaproteobacteria bacterium]|nr:MAG: hypothetical protein DRI90_18695 [Deltaproteobacteria bacterium]